MASVEVISRGDLVRAINAARRSLRSDRATGGEALDALLAELENPHTCESIYSDGDEGPCVHCGEWVESVVRSR